MPTIQEMQAQVTNLDAYTQKAVLGSWVYAVNSACISAASKFIPDVGDNGIEELTQFEAARRSMKAEAETSQIPSLIALSRDLQGLLYEVGGDRAETEDTLAIMMQRVPTRKECEDDFDNRARLGLRPAMTRRQFVDYEYEGKLAKYNNMVAKGEDAVRLCNTFDVSNNVGYNNLPSWVAETFERKLIEKLHARWLKLEHSRTNPRFPKQLRDAAAADQALIVDVLSQYGEVPGFTEDEPTAQPVSAVDKLLAHQQAKSLADMPNDDPYAPGPVTVTRFQRAPAPTA